MTKLEAAIGYARHGWKVFPCAPNTKIPMVGISHGVKDATSDTDIITEWWTKNPCANIALACGSASGVWVVDVDVRSEKGIDGFKSIEQAGLTIPNTLSQSTPSGGRHFLFSCSGKPPANKNGFLSGVDIRGDGYYIVVAPSTINGTFYTWDSCEPMADYPEEFKPISRKCSVFDSVPAMCSAPSASCLDRARAYLAEIPGAVEHVDGHAKLLWVAQVLVNGFRLSDSDAESLMWNEYNPRCSPPWNRTASTEKEFMHKISEAHAKPNAEACAIYDSVSYDNIAEEFDFDKCIDDVRSMLYPPSPTPKTKDITRQTALTNDMLMPEGLVGEIAKWMNDTSFCYQPNLALGAAIVLCGAIMGRKVCDESNGRTNVYAMGVGPSSSGKDHPGDCINRILTASGFQSMMMGRMTSDTAIEKALAASPSKIAIMDEVGHFFTNINKANGDSCLKTIKPTLMELFSSAHKTYLGKQKADASSVVIIDQPCMSLWGVTAPEKLYAGMTIEELQDGWIARNLVFIANDNIPDIVIKPSSEPPQSIVDSVRAWMMRNDGPSIISATPGQMTKPIVVPMNEEARAKFNEFNSRSRDEMRKARTRGDKTQYLWGKALQNARRVALIVACGREFENPVISRYDADYGCRLVQFLIRNTIRAIDDNVSENKWEDEKNRIRKMIEEKREVGMQQSELTRRTQWVRDAKTRMGYITDLVDAGSVRRYLIPGPGRTKTILVASQFADAYALKDGVEHVEDEE